MKKYTAKTIPSIKKINKLRKRYVAASLFAGCGGASTGLKLAGFDVRYASEFVPSAVSSYKANMPKGTVLDDRDIRKVKAEDVLKACRVKKGQLDWLDSSPPCKAFSSAAKFARIGKKLDEVVVYSDNIKQRVDDLFDNFIRILKGVKPKIFCAENVPGLLEPINKCFFLEILNKMKKAGYVVSVAVVDPSRLGVPQKRKRLVFLGVRNDLAKRGFKPIFPTPLPASATLTVRDVIPEATHMHAGAKGWNDSRLPAPTITANAYRFNEQSQMSSGGYIKNKNGDMLKLTTPQLIKLFGFPADFKLTGDWKKQWERLGRTHVPLQVYYIASTMAENVLDKL